MFHQPPHTIADWPAESVDHVIYLENKKQFWQKVRSGEETDPAYDYESNDQWEKF